MELTRANTDELRLVCSATGSNIKIRGYGEAGPSVKIDAGFLVSTIRHLLVLERVKELLWTRILGRESANPLMIIKSKWKRTAAGTAQALPDSDLWDVCHGCTASSHGVHMQPFMRQFEHQAALILENEEPSMLVASSYETPTLQLGWDAF